jgi:hypothetical protein
MYEKTKHCNNPCILAIRDSNDQVKKNKNKNSGKCHFSLI